MVALLKTIIMSEEEEYHQVYDFKGGSRVLHLSTPLEQGQHCTLRQGSTCTVCSLQRVVYTINSAIKLMT